MGFVYTWGSLSLYVNKYNSYLELLLRDHLVNKVP